MTAWTDNFDRANSATSMGSLPSGAQWDYFNGVWGISSGRARMYSETHVPEELGAYALVDVGDTTMRVSARIYGISVAASFPGIAARFDPTAQPNLYLGYPEPTNNTVVIYWRTGSTWTNLASAAYTWVDGDLMTLDVTEEPTGTRLVLFVNGVQKVSYLHTAGTRPFGTKAGLREDWEAAYAGPGATFDDFEVVFPTPPAPPAPATPPDRSLNTHKLGSGNNRAFLFDRGGSNRIGAFRNYQQVRWSRRRDDISSATLIVDPNECDDVLDKMNAGRHEIVIVRNGKRVWEGPITRITEKARTIEITAHDIWHYANRTAMRAAYDNRYSTTGSRVAPVTTRAHTILVNELSRKEALGYNLLQHLRVITSDITANTSRLSYPYEWEVWEEIDYMAAKLGLDYTAVGRSMVLFGVYEDIGRTAMLTDADFQDELVVTHYGMELATHAAVSDGEGRYAAVGANHDYYGEVELVNEVYGEGVDFADPDNPTADELEALSREMTSQAQRNLTGRLPLPAVVRVPDGTALNPNAPITMEQLVPGVRVPVRATRLRRAYQQVQKLDTLDVTQDESGEKVSVTLSPAPGTSPWDDSVETAGDEED